VVEAIVRGALARIEEAVGKGETVNLVGFGRFEVYQRSARRGRNLQTGETLKIPATAAVRFKIGKRMRDAAAGSKRKRAGKGKK
jgi:DNA-binding protein HU-beta